jgi:hypothetical protein
MIRLFFIFVGLMACDDGERDSVSATEHAVVIPSVVSQEKPLMAAEMNPVARVLSRAKGPDIQFIWTGIGQLHKGFFLSTPLIGALSKDLAGVVKSPATIHVSFDSAEHLGHIRFVMEPGVLIRPVDMSSEGVALQSLVPITQALARYRASVAGRFDLRIGSFAVGIQSEIGGARCVFGITGPPPPDGSIISGCVVIDGTSRCGQLVGSRVQFERADHRSIAACLDYSN